MPRLPINYNNAVVYKICCKDVSINNVYIGSTTNFKNRKSQHKCNCSNEKNKAYNLYVYAFIRLNGGWNNFDMIEIEKVLDCNDANELRKKERYYIELMKAKLNMVIPTRTPTEYRREYENKNKEKFDARNKLCVEKFCKLNNIDYKLLK
jgi:hypothetical protein